MTENVIFTFTGTKKSRGKKEDHIYVHLAHRIKALRNERKLSQKELAKLAQTNQVVISRIETRKANPSMFLLNRLAKALETELVLTLK